MKTLAGAIETFELSLLVRFTVTPPAGAPSERVTANVIVWPSPTVAFDGRLIVPTLATVTAAVVAASWEPRWR